MKILITLLLALFISSQAYAQSHAEVLEKGKIIQQIDEKEYKLSYYIVVYKNWAYNCRADYTEVVCSQIAGSNRPVERLK